MLLITDLLGAVAGFDTAWVDSGHFGYVQTRSVYRGFQLWKRPLSANSGRLQAINFHSDRNYSVNAPPKPAVPACNILESFPVQR
jgi:hypothetical protein